MFHHHRHLSMISRRSAQYELSEVPSILTLTSVQSPRMVPIIVVLMATAMPCISVCTEVETPLADASESSSMLPSAIEKPITVPRSPRPTSQLEHSPNH